MDPGKYDLALRNRALSMLVLRGAVAVYLIYLGGSLIYEWLSGISGLPVYVVWGGGILFIAGGVLFGLYVWQRFQKDLKAAEITENTQDTQDNEEN